MFVQGLAEWRSFGQLPLTYHEMTYKEELYACETNLREENGNFLMEVLKGDESDDNDSKEGLVCHTCSNTLSDEDIVESNDRLSILKKAVEVQGPIDVDYRCVDCRIYLGI